MTVGTRLVGAGACGFLFIVGAGYAARAVLQVGATYPWRSAVLFAVLVGGALRFIGAHPFPTLGPGNLVTLGRAALVCLVTALVGERAGAAMATTAVVAAAAAAVLDGVDGRLARRSGTASAFGARFDMETDALLILGLSVLVWQHGKAGAWVIACGLMRYGFVAVGRLLPWMAGPLSPTLRGRAVAVGQVVGLCVALAPIVPNELSVPVAALTLAALTWSFATDIVRLWRQATLGGS